MITFNKVFMKYYEDKTVSLPRITQVQGYFLAIPSFIMATIWVLSNDPLLIVLLVLVGYSLLAVTIYFWWARRPAAIIEDNTLKIYDPWSSPYSLDLSQVKEWQLKNHTEDSDLLEVLLTSGARAHIVIHDEVEHRQDDRLINFIQENCSQIPLNDHR